MGCLVREGSRRLLYYIGWNLGVTVPWRNSIGLAVSEATDAPFERVSPAPILDRCAADPYTISYPCVLREGGNWKMWYGSNLAWGATHSDMNHVIKHAQSEDGIDWRRDGRVAVGGEGEGGRALARPWVVRDKDLFRMWYAHRGTAYRIGYAESSDGLSWVRRDADVGIDAGSTGWDSESIEYPSVFDHDSRRYMLYCGNGYGRTGFGLAVLEHDR